MRIFWIILAALLALGGCFAEVWLSRFIAIVLLGLSFAIALGLSYQKKYLSDAEKSRNARS